MGFNTSHVILYQDSCSKEPLRKTRFNTSHVILYRSISVGLYRGKFVSIHLMLFFIRLLSSPDLEKMRFNTSHVILYLVPVQTGERVKTGFNTSHVILYPERTVYQWFRHTFQYISCYSLSRTVTPELKADYVSIHLMLLSIRGRDKRGRGSPVFQYISCYSLSTHDNRLCRS